MIATAERAVVRPKVRSENLRASIGKFSAWLEKSRGLSYDPYDILGTSYGRWARKIYYRKNPFGIALTAPLILTEILCPQVRVLFVKKDRYPTADAQLALGFLNLHDADQAAGSAEATLWLEKAKELANQLLEQSCPGYNGYCWGYPFDWQHVNGLMPKGTPHITATPYCYEVFTRLADLTGEARYHDIARSIATFVAEDLKDTPMAPDAAASSYTPYDQGKVVNASAYRAFVLFDAAQRFSNEQYVTKAQKNLRFILNSQAADGSWLYAIDNPPEAFIDNFHTCFVLKNLYKINRELHSAEIMRSIRAGYDFYRRQLFDTQGNPRTYAKAPRAEIVQLEMYNFAEAITLGCLLGNDIPGAFEVASELADRLIQNYQLPAGHFVTRIYRGGIRHTVPYLRWPQSQLFLSLTNLLLASETGAAVN